MIETKIIEVNELDRDECIEVFQRFGWSVLNAQKVEYAVSYMTGGGNAYVGHHYQWHHSKTSYYSITFQRDTKMEHYAEIKALNEKYLELNNRRQEILQRPRPNVRSAKGFIPLVIVPPIFGLILFSIGISWLAQAASDDGFSPAGLVLTLLGLAIVPLFLIGVHFMKKTMRSSNAILNEHKKKIQQEINETEAEIDRLFEELERINLE